jgi:hypothetical protein
MDSEGYRGPAEAPSPEDLTIVCIDCATLFMFTVGEQRFFKSKNFTTPFRCRLCRNLRRAAREREQAS